MTFISGDDLEKMLSGTMATGIACRSCGSRFTFEEGGTAAINAGIHGKVMCPKCHAVFDADVTPRGVTLGNDVTSRYPQAKKRKRFRFRR